MSKLSETKDKISDRKGSQAGLPCLSVFQCRSSYVQYPVYNAAEGGHQRRYIETKGILELDIKGKTCKVDFNMMLPNDYPKSPPFVRIVNRNPDYFIDPYYQ
jgi:hypothetical protein